MSERPYCGGPVQLVPSVPVLIISRLDNHLLSGMLPPTAICNANTVACGPPMIGQADVYVNLSDIWTDEVKWDDGGPSLSIRREGRLNRSAG